MSRDTQSDQTLDSNDSQGSRGIQIPSKATTTTVDAKTAVWTKEDDEKLSRLHRSWGNNWGKIALEFPGRLPYTLRLRWREIEKLALPVRKSLVFDGNESDKSSSVSGQEESKQAIVLTRAHAREVPTWKQEYVSFEEESSMSYEHIMGRFIAENQPQNKELRSRKAVDKQPSHRTTTAPRPNPTVQMATTQQDNSTTSIVENSPTQRAPVDSQNLSSSMLTFDDRTYLPVAPPRNKAVASYPCPSCSRTFVNQRLLHAHTSKSHRKKKARQVDSKSSESLQEGASPSPSAGRAFRGQRGQSSQPLPEMSGAVEGTSVSRPTLNLETGTWRRAAATTESVLNRDHYKKVFNGTTGFFMGSFSRSSWVPCDANTGGLLDMQLPIPSPHTP